MLTDQDFIELMEDLNSEDVSLKAATLRAFWKLPSGDKRVLSHLEGLLDNKIPCVLGYPYMFGEVRWLAAKALAAEQEAQGNHKLVRLQNVVIPIDTMGIMQAADSANIRVQGGVEGIIETFVTLHEMGYLPTYDLLLSPQPSQARHPQRQQSALVPLPAH